LAGPAEILAIPGGARIDIKFHDNVPENALKHDQDLKKSMLAYVPEYNRVDALKKKGKMVSPVFGYKRWMTETITIVSHPVIKVSADKVLWHGTPVLDRFHQTSAGLTNGCEMFFTLRSH
jgi:hypothetical protein